MPTLKRSFSVALIRLNLLHQIYWQYFRKKHEKASSVFVFRFQLGVNKEMKLLRTLL